MWRGIVYVGIVMAAATLLVLDGAMPGGLIEGHGTLRYGQTMAFNTLMLAQMFNVLNARSDVRSAVTHLFSNGWLWLALAVSVGLQVLVIHLPLLQQAFGTVGLSGADWMISVAAASAVLWAREATKLVARLRARPSEVRA
jgi:Ca2+-transporting ATPase